MDFTTIMLMLNAAIFGYLLGCFREMLRAEKYYRPLLDERAESLEKAYIKVDRLRRIAKNLQEKSCADQDKMQGVGE